MGGTDTGYALDALLALDTTGVPLPLCLTELDPGKRSDSLPGVVENLGYS